MRITYLVIVDVKESTYTRDHCDCRDCAVCHGVKMICGECGMCCRCHNHRIDCRGCSDGHIKGTATKLFAEEIQSDLESLHHDGIEDVQVIVLASDEKRTA